MAGEGISSSSTVGASASWEDSFLSSEGGAEPGGKEGGGFDAAISEDDTGSDIEAPGGWLGREELTRKGEGGGS